MERESVLWSVISKSAGFILFLTLVAAASYLQRYFDYSVYKEIVKFFVDNLSISFMIYIS